MGGRIAGIGGKTRSRNIIENSSVGADGAKYICAIFGNLDLPSQSADPPSQIFGGGTAKASAGSVC